MVDEQPGPTETEPQVDAPQETAVVVDLVPSQDGDNDVPTQAEINAPQSWGVAEREHWAALDPAVQAQIEKREKEIGHSLTTTGEARKFHEEFNTTIQPFEHFITAEGATPMQAVGNLLQTAATLQGGSPQQKAARIAELIGHYGIDIRTLDSLLAGEIPEDPQEAQLGQMLDQRLAPMNHFMQQQQMAEQQQYQQQQTAVGSELDTFMAKHEFTEDVRTEMADLMEMAGRRGQTLTLDQAYERALLLRPDIQEIVQQRIAAGQAKQNNQTVAQKQAAAVSVAGGNAAMGGEKPGTDIRSALLAAWGDS